MSSLLLQNLPSPCLHREHPGGCTLQSTRFRIQHTSWDEYLTNEHGSSVAPFETNNMVHISHYQQASFSHLIIVTITPSTSESSQADRSIINTHVSLTLPFIPDYTLRNAKSHCKTYIHLVYTTRTQLQERESLGYLGKGYKAISSSERRSIAKQDKNVFSKDDRNEPQRLC
jgi:hypothetical protein